MDVGPVVGVGDTVEELEAPFRKRSTELVVTGDELRDPSDVPCLRPQLDIIQPLGDGACLLGVG